MVIEKCKVVDKKNKDIIVELERTERCGECKQCAFGKKNKIRRIVLSEVEVQVGDDVEVAMPEKKFAATSLILYLLPIIFIFIGIAVGSGMGELWQAILALAFSLLAFPIIYIVDKYLRKHGKYMPVIIKNISKGDIS